MNMKGMVRVSVRVEGEVIVPRSDVKDVERLNAAGLARMLETHGVNLKSVTAVAKKGKKEKPAPAPEQAPEESPEQTPGEPPKATSDLSA